MEERLVLIAEDDPVNQRLATKILRHQGFQVCLAGDGAQAIDLARSRRPAVILMDLSMPVMNGWDATQRLKADPALATIPVVACTAHAMVGDAEKVFAAGCDGYVSKPYTPDELLGAISRVLR